MRTKLIGVAAFVLGAASAFAIPTIPTVSKTVGTSSVGCAPTNSAVVVTGTQVYYCYQITNPLSDPMVVLLEDDKLGSFGNFTVGPLATVTRFAHTAIASNVTNIATWFYQFENTSINGNVTAMATVGAENPPPVPTLSDLGLIALGVGTLALSLHFLRRA